LALAIELVSNTAPPSRIGGSIFVTPREFGVPSLTHRTANDRGS
jgi:hypothetical protein